MALIACPECQHQVSDMAPACPSCGYQLPKQARTIEQTGKSYKMWMVVGGLITLAGLGYVAMMAMGHAAPEKERTESMINGAMVAAGGMAVYFTAKMNAWWRHG